MFALPRLPARRGYVDYLAAAPLLLHLGDKCLGAEISAANFNVYHPLEDVIVKLQYGNTVRATRVCGIVHQNIYSTELLNCLVNHVLDVIRVRHVRDQGESLDAV